MRRTLLPAVLAAASVTALAVPATAAAPPPAPDAYNEPAEQSYTKDDCAQALNILTHFKLLPNQPDVGRTLCSLNEKNRQEQAAQNEKTTEINSKHTASTG